MRLPRLAPGAGARPDSFLVGDGSQPEACGPCLRIPEGGSGGSPCPTGPPPCPRGKDAQDSQRGLHPIGGDRGGRAWDPPEVAGREGGRLKHVIGHGAHFFLGWGGAGVTGKESMRSHCPKYRSQYLDSRTEQSQTGSLGGKWKARACQPHGGSPGGTLPCQVLNRETGAQEFHKVAHPIPPRGLWISQGLLAEHNQGQVTSPNSQATPHPVPEAHTPCLPY